MKIIWKDLKDVLSCNKSIITDTKFGCYEQNSKYLVPGKFDNLQVEKLSAIGTSIYVKLI